MMTGLNAAFKPTNITFNLAGVENVVLPEKVSDMFELYFMKEQWRKGSPRDLNILLVEKISRPKTLNDSDSEANEQSFSKVCHNLTATARNGTILQGKPSQSLAGICSPREFFAHHGCVLDVSLEGLTKTAIHEIGHWFALPHTHHKLSLSNYSNPGILGYVPTKCPQFGYPGNACPSVLPQINPNHNYMSYSARSVSNFQNCTTFKLTDECFL